MTDTARDLRLQTCDKASGVLSRRALLQSGGLTALASVLAGTLFTATANAATPLPPASGRTPTKQDSTPATRRPPRSRRKPVLDANGNLIQPGPFAIQASCELSQDFFSTDDVIIGADDRIAPFVNIYNNGAVEAVVLSAGVVSHLYRDPSATSGWTFAPISLNTAAVSDMQVGAGSGGVAIMTVDSTTSAVTPTVTWLTDATTWADSAQPGSVGNLTAFRGGATTDGLPVFYGWGDWGQIERSGTAYDQYALYTWIGTATGKLEYRNPTVIDTFASDQVTIADAILQWNESDALGESNDAAPGFLAVVTDTATNPVGSQRDLTVYPQERGGVDLDNQIGDTAVVQTLLWAYSAAGAATLNVIWTDASGNVLTEDGTPGSTSFNFGGDVSDGAVAPWLINGSYTLALLDEAGQLSLRSQYAGSFTDPIPLVDGVARVYSLPTDPAEATLFAVMADETLTVLTKNADSGWSQAQVHQAAPVTSEVASWRVTARVLDANTAPVQGAQVSIQADRLIGIWQDTGNQILLPDATVTLTTDTSGALKFSIPAEELDTAVFTAQALDTGGNPSGPALTITPHIDVHTFLAGQGSLTDIGTLTGPGLLQASTPSGAAVFPALASMQDPAAGADQVAQAITHVAGLGLGMVPKTPTDIRSAVFDLTGPTASFTSSATPGTYTPDIAQLNAQRKLQSLRLGLNRRLRSSHSIGGVEDWWKSVEHDAESVFHGLRHGATTFKKLITNWDSDARQWTVNLIVDIGDGLDTLISYVITDIKTAVHAISNFFDKLGADIEKAIEWLKHAVLDLIKNAHANALVIEGWILDVGPSLSQQIDGWKVSVDETFERWQDDLTGLITEAADDAAAANLNFKSIAPILAVDGYVGSSLTDTLADVGENVSKIGKIVHYIDLQWLFDKMMAHLPRSLSDMPTFSTPMDSIISALLDKLGSDTMTEINDLALAFHSTFADSVSSMDSLNNVDWADLVEQLGQVSLGFLQLGDDLADLMLDVLNAGLANINDVLSFDLQAPAFITDLFRLAGIDLPSVTVGYLVSLLTAYPATLVNGVVNDGAPLFPSGGATAALGALEDAWGSALGWSSFGAQLVWTLVDMYEDAKVGDAAESVPGWMNWVDIAAPIVLMGLGWPSSPTNSKAVAPFSTRFPTAEGKDGDLLPGILAANALPSVLNLVCTAAASYTGSTAWEQYDQDSKDVQSIVQSASGLAAIVLSSIYNWRNDLSAPTKALGIESGLSYLFAPLGIKAVGEATEGTSYIAKFLLDTAANAATTCTYVVAAGQATFG